MYDTVIRDLFFSTLSVEISLKAKSLDLSVSWSCLTRFTILSRMGGLPQSLSNGVFSLRRLDIHLLYSCSRGSFSPLSNKDRLPGGSPAFRASITFRGPQSFLVLRSPRPHVPCRPPYDFPKGPGPSLP